MILIITFSLIFLLCLWATNEAIRDEEKIELTKTLEETTATVKWLWKDRREWESLCGSLSNRLAGCESYITDLQNKYDSLVEEYYQSDKELVKLKYHTKYPPWQYVDKQPVVIKATDGCPSYRMIVSKEPTILVFEDIRLHKLVYSISTEIGMYSEISMPHLIEQLKLGFARTVIGSVQEITKFSEVASKLNRKYLLDGVSGERHKD